MKKHLILLLSVLLVACLVGCEDSFSDMVKIVFSDSALPTETPAIAATEIPATPVPTETPEPTPEITPEPTPEPTPTPHVAVYYGEDAWDNLFMDQKDLKVLGAARKRVILYDEPQEEKDAEQLKNRTTYGIYDIVVLDTVTGEDGNDYYYVQSSFSLDRGYMPVSKTTESVIYDPEVTGKYAIMTRPGSYIFYTTNVEDKLVAQENYNAVRILGSKMQGKNTKFYYVATQDGHFGFMQPEQLSIVTREQMEQYLAYGKIEDCEESFSLESFTDTVEQLEGTQATSMSEFVYEQLEKAGVFFQPGYYRYLRKPLGNKELYPNGFYQDDVYNSRVYKLWNSAGNLVKTEDSDEMEWEYIDDYKDVQRGDLIFFSEYRSSDKPIIDNVEVVFRGKYSGYITDCAVALGDDRILLADNGIVKVVESFSSTSKFKYFDSARRIHNSVEDVKAHLWEMVICAIYDRLGTPYNNFSRLGDVSYDCSGIICWAMRSLGVHRSKITMKTLLPETTASGWGTTRLIYLADGTKCEMNYVNPYTGVKEDIKNLERGDLVLLFGSKHKIQHIMVYLGNNTVIHSTTINEKYRGTLVAQIRTELRNLYYGANRMTAVGVK